MQRDSRVVRGASKDNEAQCCTAALTPRAAVSHAVHQCCGLETREYASKGRDYRARAAEMCAKWYNRRGRVDPRPREPRI